MTLSKQLIILITTIFIAIFAGNFIISVKNIKSYLELEAQSHAQDTATSLGLSITPYAADPSDPMIETMMNAIFDRGYYKEIKFLDMDGNELIRLENKNIFSEVPGWFKNSFTFIGSTASTMVSSGWMPAGTLFVTSNPGYGYLKLYQQAKSALYYSLTSFVIAMVVVLIFLRFLLRPLKRIEILANHIAQGKFETIEKLPWTTEIKNVANSINMMSKKIEKVITKLNENLNSVNKKLKIDELTGLEIKSSFETHIKSMFIDHSDGYILIAKIDNLKDYAKNHSDDQVDDFIKAFAQILIESGKKYEKLRVYRFFGSEFAIVAEKMNMESTKEYLLNIQQNLKTFSENTGKKEIAHFGGTPFNQIGTIPEILSAANEAYEKARIVGPNQYHLRDSKDLARDMNEWKELVFDIIDNLKFKVDFIGQSVRFEDGNLFMEEAFTQAFDKNGEPIPIGTFISIAEKYDKIIDLDKGVILRVIQHLRETKSTNDMTINLSLSTLHDNSFRSWLFNILNENKTMANQLVFTTTAYGAAKDIDSFESFINFAHRGGAKVMIKRFESQFIAMEKIKELNLDYIRLARDYTNEISKDKAKKAFVESMKELGELLNIKIFAESVKSDNDLEVIKEVGLYGAGR